MEVDFRFSYLKKRKPYRSLLRPSLCLRKIFFLKLRRRTVLWDWRKFENTTNGILISEYVEITVMISNVIRPNVPKLEAVSLLMKKKSVRKLCYVNNSISIKVYFVKRHSSLLCKDNDNNNKKGRWRLHVEEVVHSNYMEDSPRWPDSMAGAARTSRPGYVAPWSRHWARVESRYHCFRGERL